MISYSHWDVEYQGGDRATTNAIIAEAVKRRRRSVRQTMLGKHVQIRVPAKFSGDKGARKRYIEGYIDGFSALLASFD